MKITVRASPLSNSRVRRGMAEMLKGGVIMDVVNVEQARIAEASGAVAVMALEHGPVDVRNQGGFSRWSNPDRIDAILAVVSIPVIAKARIGHFVGAQVLQSFGVDYIDESEGPTPAHYLNHIDKWKFSVPFVCSARNFAEALCRITEGAAMIRSGTASHIRQIQAGIAKLAGLSEDELSVAAKELQAPYELVREIAATGKLPVPLFIAGGIATPADAAMMMQLGADGVFVGSDVFTSGNPSEHAAALVRATAFHDYPEIIAMISHGLGESMAGVRAAGIPQGPALPNTADERGMYAYKRWSLLKGEPVEVRFSGKTVRSGFVDTAMPDDSALWLAAEGADGRRLFEAADGYEVWVASELFRKLA